MSNEDGSTIMRKPSIRYTKRSTVKPVRRVAYLEPDLAQYVKDYCAKNGISESALFNDLVRWLKDEA